MTGQRPSQHSRIDPLFVGITGRIGAGKTSAAKYFSSKYSFQYTRYSQVLQEWRSLDCSDKNQLQGLGWDMMAAGLQVELNSRLIAGLDLSRSAAIDGLRHPIDFASLSSAFGGSLLLIFIEAGEEVRFKRLRSRFSTYIAFQAAESHPVEAHIDDLTSLATVTISNEQSLESLHQRLDAWMAALGWEDRK